MINDSKDFINNNKRIEVYYIVLKYNYVENNNLLSASD